MQCGKLWEGKAGIPDKTTIIQFVQEIISKIIRCHKNGYNDLKLLSHKSVATMRLYLMPVYLFNLVLEAIMALSPYLPFITLPYRTLPHLTLPKSTLSYLTLPYFTLPSLTLNYPTRLYLTLPCLTLP